MLSIFLLGHLSDGSIWSLGGFDGRDHIGSSIISSDVSRIVFVDAQKKGRDSDQDIYQTKGITSRIRALSLSGSTYTKFKWCTYFTVILQYPSLISNLEKIIFPLSAGASATDQRGDGNICVGVQS